VAFKQASRSPHHERRRLGMIRVFFQTHIEMARWMLDAQIGG
jgi:hypothetical protein